MSTFNQLSEAQQLMLGKGPGEPFRKGTFNALARIILAGGDAS